MLFADCLCDPFSEECTVSYTMESNKQYFGAREDTSAGTKAACEDQCTKNTNCLGYGLNTNTNPGVCSSSKDKDVFCGTEDVRDCGDGSCVAAVNTKETPRLFNFSTLRSGNEKTACFSFSFLAGGVDDVCAFRLLQMSAGSTQKLETFLDRLPAFLATTHTRRQKPAQLEPALDV